MKNPDTAPVLAISIRQPYVEQILLGTKTAEYRSMRTHVRGTVYLYASLTPSEDEEAWSDVNTRPGALPTGAIVGTVDIVGCEVEDGDFAYQLENPKRFSKPLRAVNKAQPVFWKPRFA